MNNNKKRAKEIYFYYACNHFFLDRENEEYKGYGITKAEEEKWKQEYITDWIGKLSASDFTALHRLRDAGADKALPALMRIAREGDTHSQLEFADAIFWIANGVMKPQTIHEQAIRLAFSIWESLANQPQEGIANDAKYKLSEAREKEQAMKRIRELLPKL